MLKFVYSLFLGLLLSVFVGIGVATFYPEPKAPEYPTILREQMATDKYTVEQKQADHTYQQSYDIYNKKQQSYNRNVAMIILGAAVVLLVVGLAMENRVRTLADGFLLGGTFSLLYSIGRSFAGNDPKYSFVVVTIALVVTMVVGYLKFIKIEADAKPARAKGKK